MELADKPGPATRISTSGTAESSIPNMRVKSLLIVGMHLPLFAQQTEVLAFDVASIKRAPPDSEDRSMYNFPGRLTVANLVTRSLIASAYGVLTEQILGAPAWVNFERYDIDARCEEPQSLSAADIDRRNMVRLRALLESRFQLKTHREAREWQTYVLVAGTWAGKLTPTRRTEERYRRSGNHGHTEWEGATMDDLCQHLAAKLQRPVINRTGIEGRFDFVLDFENPATPAGQETWPSLFTSLPNQLGLKLESRKGPVDFLVVDQVERPSGN